MIREYGIVCVELSGPDLTVAAAREWLERVSAVGIADDAKLEINGGTLRVVLRRPHVEPLHCGDCSPATEHVGHSLWDRDCRPDSQ